MHDSVVSAFNIQQAKEGVILGNLQFTVSKVDLSSAGQFPVCKLKKKWDIVILWKCELYGCSMKIQCWNLIYIYIYFTPGSWDIQDFMVLILSLVISSRSTSSRVHSNPSVPSSCVGKGIEKGCWLSFVIPYIYIYVSTHNYMWCITAVCT